MAVSKGETYTDFETFFAAEGSYIGDYFSAMWIYEFEGKSIQFSASAEGGRVDLSMVLLG